MLCHEYVPEYHQNTTVPDQLREPFLEGHQFFGSTSVFYKPNCLISPASRLCFRVIASGEKRFGNAGTISVVLSESNELTKRIGLPVEARPHRYDNCI